MTELCKPRTQRITLLTNGTLISDGVAGRIREAGVRRVSVSIDGLQEKHEAVRGRNSFAAAVRGIQNLVACGIYPNVSVTPLRSTVSDLGAVIDLSVSLGASSITINTLSPEGRCAPIFSAVRLRYPDDVASVLSVVAEKRKAHPGIPMKCELGFYLTLPESYRLSAGNSDARKPPSKPLMEGCSACAGSLTITATGNIVPCVGFEDLVGGNVRTHDILDVWRNGAAFNQLRHVRGMKTEDIPECADCQYTFLCDGGCRAVPHMIYGDIVAPDPHCPYWVGSRDPARSNTTSRR
jgi:radical SAM protein with 4Fe4S-binding SPASM domain